MRRKIDRRTRSRDAPTPAGHAGRRGGEPGPPRRGGAGRAPNPGSPEGAWRPRRARGGSQTSWGRHTLAPGFVSQLPPDRQVVEGPLPQTMRPEEALASGRSELSAHRPGLQGLCGQSRRAAGPSPCFTASCFPAPASAFLLLPSFRASLDIALSG